MKRLLLAAVAFLFSATITFAQEQAAPSPKILPMFGGIMKTEKEQKQDEKFLKSCDASFTSRQEASQFFMDRGWEYYAEGKTDTAMYRFNLAWLLNPDNGDTYWAFGLVSAAAQKHEEALGLYNRAVKYFPKNSMLYSDMATAHLNMYKEKNKKRYLKNASKSLTQAIEQDAGNAFALYSYSEIKYLEKKYADAWNYLHKAREINIASLDYNYLSELMAKMPDPKGFFSDQPKTE